MLETLTKHNFKNTIVVKSDLGAQNPIYIYISKNKQHVYISNNIKEILSHKNIKRELTISVNGISFLLQSGVVPTPNSIYNNLYILNIAEQAIINYNNVFSIEFETNFGFTSNVTNLKKFDSEELLDLIAIATISKIKNKNNFLFQTAGKDSNTILLSLYKKDFKDIVCVTHTTDEKDKDESVIAKNIAKKLGYEHISLKTDFTGNSNEIERNIVDYMTNISLPSMDLVSLAYVFYKNQINLSNDSCIVDGMGNDSYIGHIPSKNEFNRQKYFSKFYNFKSISNFFPSYSYANIITRTRAEWTGFNGINFRESKSIFNKSINVSNFWIQESNNTLDYFDLRASTRGRYLDQEMFIRKVRNFADVNNSNLVLPWLDENVIKYIRSVNSNDLYDKHNLINKIALRKMLKKEIGLDSDTLGKFGFNYNPGKLMLHIKKFINNEIRECYLWNHNRTNIFLKNLWKSLENDVPASFKYNYAEKMILRLFIISSFVNHNKYIKGN